jgi:hypothetical protein
MNFLDIPFNDIVKFGQRTMLQNDLFSVSWILGRFCNYKCSYCWPYARTDSIDHQSLSIYYNTIDEIKRQAQNNGFTKFHWSFSGGEPTAYKDLLKLIGYLDDKTTYQSIHMTTNLSPSLNWWGKWCEYTANLGRRSITASFHAEFANEDEFIEKCLFLMKNNVLITINQVMVVDCFYELYNRCIKFHECGINVTLKPQSDSTASKIVDNYTNDMITLMKSGFPQQVNGDEIYQISLYDSNFNTYYFDQAERFNAFGFNKFTGWECNAGFQGLVIRNNEVKRSYSCHDEILGTLTDGFQIYNKPKQCITPTCVSSADSKIPKCKI